MKKFTLIFAGGVIIAAYLGVRSVQKSGEGTPRRSAVQAPVAPRPLSLTQTNDEGAVSVTVTPKDFRQGIYEVTLDTHSVELSDDVAQKATLWDRAGAEYGPAVWEGDPPAGHHRVGLLKFGPLSADAGAVELIIKDIGGVGERMFAWDIAP